MRKQKARKSMTTNRRSISPATVIFRTFPQAFWNFTNAIVRVQSISSQEGEQLDRLARYVREAVAELMTQERLRSETLQREQRRRRRLQQPTETNTTDSDAVIDEILGSIMPLDLVEVDTEEDIQPVRSSRVSFILVNDQVHVRTHIFPRTFHCKNCGHFAALDPGRPPATLECPCCHNGRLVQEPIVFGCAKCATIRELTPRGQRISTTARRRTQQLDDLLGSYIQCPDCSTGHIHLEKHNTNLVTRWQWNCTECTSYRNEEIQEFCLNCYLPHGDGPDQPSEIVSMNAFPASASNALRPLVHIQMFIGEEPLEPETLHNMAQTVAQNWPDYFELAHAPSEATQLTGEDVSSLLQASLANAYLLNRVKVVSTVYGYRAGGIMNHPQSPVAEDERLAKLFLDPEGLAKYVCYGMRHEGAALVLELNKTRVMERLAELYPQAISLSYDEALEREQSFLAGARLREILEVQAHNLPLLTALHGMEHALLTSATRLLGNEVLGSILFQKAGIILLYERETVGRGGVIQLVNGGPGLLALVSATRDQVAGCARGCADGCPSCMYLLDTRCQYHKEELNFKWLPPNTLLSRTGARKLVESDFLL
jgi:hypothetical protein